MALYRWNSSYYFLTLCDFIGTILQLYRNETDYRYNDYNFNHQASETIRGNENKRNNSKKFYLYRTFDTVTIGFLSWTLIKVIFIPRKSSAFSSTYVALLLLCICIRIVTPTLSVSI